jgi:hypothetical protein
VDRGGQDGSDGAQGVKVDVQLLLDRELAEHNTRPQSG